MVGESARETKVSKMEAHGDIHVQLPLHRSDMTVNGENTPMAGVVSTVIGDGILHNGIDDTNIGKVVGKGLQGSKR